ncbi:ATP-binding protein [Actinomadura formosensis]|uniref:ATP-binding protein n=1 Tax=Actinomadura formosensis TaxID=60706 RepID=UPI003D93A843
MESRGARVLVAGGVGIWQLPRGETGPGAARRLLHEAMAGLGVDRDVIEDGKLAVSETATNALRHGRTPDGRPPVAPELWIWARTVPAPQLIVSVFDGARTDLPHRSGAGLLDEHGKGLGLLGEFTAAWGCALTRSRVTETPLPGKAVWFALPLPDDWPGRTLKVHPGTAAQCLLSAVTRRGFPGMRTSDERGMSVVVLPGLNVWVYPQHFCWREGPGRYLRRPHVDLQETTELIVRHLDAIPTRPCSPTP